MFVTVATNTNSIRRHGTELSTGLGDMHPAPMFFHSSPAKFVDPTASLQAMIL